MKNIFAAALILLFVSSGLSAEQFLSAPETRKVTLKGTRNTRELGGLPTAGGTFKQGMVYRSGALCFASRQDAEQLLGLKIQTLLELRLDSEIERDGPDKDYLTQGVSSNIHWPMKNSRGIGREAYVSYMEDNGPLFKDFFELLAKKESYPILYHCSAGKDRTGILTALLLEVLGTPREVIYDDYLHSRRITPKLKVEREWLDAVFEAVDSEGGIEPFLSRLGVSKATLSSVKTRLNSTKL